MTKGEILGALWAIVFLLAHLGVLLRAMLRPHREPASRVAWVIMILVVPVGGMIAYLLLGETSIGRRRAARLRAVLVGLPDVNQTVGLAAPGVRPRVPERYEHLFKAGQSVNGFQPVGGNRARLLPDSNAAIHALIQDIDAARAHVHLAFYIWLPDHNGLQVVEALKRAARRGVACRAMADALGSRILIESEHWKGMADAGVKVATALPIGNLLLRPLRGRIDLRNHRKIVVIDNQITYCGSQNCADPEFRIKAKYAPWVDVMARFDGPIARQNQALFAADWMSQIEEDLSGLLRQPLASDDAGFTGQVIGTGPTVRPSAMAEIFETLIHGARHELFITTPYYVPNEAMQAALCAAARRGVATWVILPARNDSAVVAAASRGYYADLLAAGVLLHEYEGGLLHAKTLTLDGEVTLIGSANMDRRSFELNYENNILACDPAFTAEVRIRQEAYLERCSRVRSEDVAAWSMGRRLWNNAVGMMGPVL